jgi:hypothetical protein
MTNWMKVVRFAHGRFSRLSNFRFALDKNKQREYTRIMLQITYTNHAVERIENRLNSLVSVNEITNALGKRYFQNGRTYQEIKRIPYSEIKDPSVQPDGIARGDMLVAAVDYCKRENVAKVVTVILRKSWSKSDIYSRIS